MAEQTNNDVPGPGLDDLWWRTAASSADAADKEKAAVAAADFQQHRAFRYLASGGMDDCGGFVQPSALSGGRQMDYRHLPRGMVWR